MNEDAATEESTNEGESAVPQDKNRKPKKIIIGILFVLIVLTFITLAVLLDVLDSPWSIVTSVILGVLMFIEGFVVAYLEMKDKKKGPTPLD
jgi:uncharacterized integral membrane protein